MKNQLLIYLVSDIFSSNCSMKLKTNMKKLDFLFFLSVSISLLMMLVHVEEISAGKTEENQKLMKKSSKNKTSSSILACCGLRRKNKKSFCTSFWGVIDLALIILLEMSMLLCKAVKHYSHICHIGNKYFRIN